MFVLSPPFARRAASNGYHDLLKCALAECSGPSCAMSHCPWSSFQAILRSPQARKTEQWVASLARVVSLLFVALPAYSQICYQFSNAQSSQPPTAVVTVTISAIPPSLMGAGNSNYGAGFTSASSLSSGGTNFYYSATNVVTITASQATYTYNYFSIGITYNQSFNETILQINGSQYPPGGGNTFALTLMGAGNLLPDGLTPTLPPFNPLAGTDAFTNGTLFFGPPFGVTFNATITSIISACAVSSPAILLDGTPVIGTAQVLVGQRIALSTSLPADAVPAAGQPWAVEGMTIGGFAVTPSFNDPQKGDLTSTDFTQAATIFYWLLPGTFSVTFSYVLNGQNASLHATFNVGGPIAPFVGTDLGSFNIGACPGNSLPPPTVCLNLGTPPATPEDPPTQAGITFSASATLPVSNPGNYQWVQLISKDSVVLVTGRGQYTCPARTGLDSTYPYENVNPVSDSPAAPLQSVASQETRTFSATMYLMWNPALPSGCTPPQPSGEMGNCSSIMVPLGSVSWQFTGAASKPPTSNQWTLNDPSSTINASPFVPFMNEDAFPQWNSLHTMGPVACYPVSRPLR